MEGNSSMCEPIRIPLCQDMPYNATRMPNLMAQNSQDEALMSLEPFYYLPFTSCSPYLIFFLCVIHTPICTSELPIPLDPIPPCRQVCNQVRNNCEPHVIKMGYTWPRSLECRNFPDIHKGVCLTPESVLNQTTAVQARNPESCPCFRHPKLKYRLYTQRKFQYAIRGKVHNTETFGGLTLSHLYVFEVFKRSQVALTAKSRVVLWTNSSCGTCPRLDPGREYFLLGHEDVRFQRLLFTEQSVALEWRMKFALLVQKWESGKYKSRAKDRRKARKGKGKGRKNQTTPAPASTTSSPPTTPTTLKAISDDEEEEEEYR